MNEILTVKQIARKLQVDPETVYRWLRNGKLTGYRANRLWRIAEHDLMSFLERKTGAEPEHGNANIKSKSGQVAGSAPSSME